MYKNNKSVLNNSLREVVKILKENIAEKELNKFEIISFQNFFSYDGSKDVNLKKKTNEKVRVKVRFDI